jgi:hypothetical protein
MRNRILLGIITLTVIAGLTLSAPAGVARAEATTQTGQAGAVTIKATWQGLYGGPLFTIVLDTHAVNLDAYDLGQLALLRTEQGVEIAPISWEAPAGGHHRQGTLAFPLTQPDGSPVLTGDTRQIELSIRNVGGVSETVLRWELP